MLLIKDKDFAWMKAHAFGDVKFSDVSADYAQLALQGPKSEHILAQVTDEKKYSTKILHLYF